MELRSSAFKHEQMIPRKYTWDGPNTSPPLSWSGMPEGTKSLALICDDPDAPLGTWVHWVIYDIPAGMSQLAEGMSGDGELSDGTRQGKNDFRKLGYGGPCPPGGTHRYFFRLFALDKVTGLAPGSSKEQLLKEMKGHILAEAQLIGKYRR